MGGRSDRTVESCVTASITQDTPWSQSLLGVWPTWTLGQGLLQSASGPRKRFGARIEAEMRTQTPVPPHPSSCSTHRLLKVSSMTAEGVGHRSLLKQMSPLTPSMSRSSLWGVHLQGTPVMYLPWWRGFPVQRLWIQVNSDCGKTRSSTSGDTAGAHLGASAHSNWGASSNEGQGCTVIDCGGENAALSCVGSRSLGPMHPGSGFFESCRLAAGSVA